MKTTSSYSKNLILFIVVLLQQTTLVRSFVIPSTRTSARGSSIIRSQRQQQSKKQNDNKIRRRNNHDVRRRIPTPSLLNLASDDNENTAEEDVTPPPSSSSSFVMLTNAANSNIGEEENVDEDDRDTKSTSDVQQKQPSWQSPSISKRTVKQRLIFLISDATGVTARSTLLKALTQFDGLYNDDTDTDVDPDADVDDDHHDTHEYHDSNQDDNSVPDGSSSSTSSSSTTRVTIRTRTFTFIRSQSTLTQILQKAKEKDACIIYTFADESLRTYVQEFALANSVPAVDLVGPSLAVLSQFLSKRPLGITPSSLQKNHNSIYLGDSYYRRINAVEFALKADDGQSPWLLQEADIILVGVSRSGKTPCKVFVFILCDVIFLVVLVSHALPVSLSLSLCSIRRVVTNNVFEGCQYTISCRYNTSQRIVRSFY
jgi:regulator of PEP synthase PpsR (kinase-PPPase family)